MRFKKILHSPTSTNHSLNGGLDSLNLASLSINNLTLDLIPVL
jgi:hypothetical protein